MKVVKNINNNVSLCLDNKGNECIIMGKGVGFIKPPADVPLEKIERTFYNVNDSYLSVLSSLDSNVIRTSARIVDYANYKFNDIYRNNVTFTLADHIDFAISRYKEKLNVNLPAPLYYDVKKLYPDEMEIGKWAINYIKDKLKVVLLPEEAASIALHFVNGRVENSETLSKSLLDRCCDVIEQSMEIKINKEGFNYTRFVTHIYYLLDRSDNKLLSGSDNANMYEQLTKQYPKAYQCAVKIMSVLNKKLNDEELIYLIIHINRLCSREDCYRDRA